MVGFALGALTLRQIHKARETLVSANGTVVTRTEYLHRLDAATNGSVLRQIVDDNLAIAFAREHGLSPSTAEIEKQYKLLSQDSRYNARLLSPIEIKRGVVASLSRQAIAAAGVVPTEAQIRAYYDANTNPRNLASRYYSPETAQVVVIVTKSAEDAHKAFEMLQQGIAADEVALKYSNDISRRHGGMLSPIQRGRTRASRYPGFDDYLFSLEPGGNGAPKMFGGAWWVVHCVSKVPARTRPFAEVHDECRTAVAVQSGANRAMDAEYAAYVRKAKIRIFDSRYRSVLPAGE
ncbi:MAG TPA: peptidylprolyl isomerase [Capsulimonadaceae bacterium]